VTLIKNNKGKMLLSSLLILLPMFFGLLLWDRLPELMATHWGFDGAADGYGGRALAVFLPPLLMLALHWLGMLLTGSDPQNKEQTRTGSNLVFWIVPLLSLVINGMLYATAFGAVFDVSSYICIVTGLLFVVLGNFMPKIKQNSTMGIKIHWALQDEENWNATHRFGGKVWVIGGLLLLLAAFLPGGAAAGVMMGSVALLALLPMLYSYLFYRKRKAAGVDFAPPSPWQKKWNRIGLGIAAVILLLVGVMLFTGEVEVQFDEDSFFVKADGWAGRSVSYADIETMEYRESDDPGSRVGGVGSFRLLAGQFENDEFGGYTRYSYTGCQHCVVLQVKGKALVINGADEAATRAIYDTLLQKTGG